QFMVWWNAASFEIGGFRSATAMRISELYINELEKILFKNGKTLEEFFVNLSHDGSISLVDHRTIKTPSQIKEFYRHCLWGMSIPYTLPIALEMAPDLQGKTILDLGCGFGRLSLLCRLRGAKRVVAADISNPLINSLRNTIEALHLTNIEPRLLDAENPQLEKNQFDIIYFCEVIEHLPNPKQALRQIWHLLKPGGSLILSTPNGLNVVGFKQAVYNFLGNNWKSPYGGGQPELHMFTPMSLTRLLQETGFEVTALRGAELIDNLALIYPSNLAIGITQFLPIIFRPFRKIKNGLIRLGKTRLFKKFGIELFIKASPLKKQV
ncbi:MAG: class I SAM-dependent methyltransferase, partial [Candidatus Helarchaeota archaeon]